MALNPESYLFNDPRRHTRTRQRHPTRWQCSCTRRESRPRAAKRCPRTLDPEPWTLNPEP